MVGKYFLLASAALGISLAAVNFAHADESGLSFWLPGEFGSFAAVPGVPGWSVSTFYYHPSAIGGGSKLFQQGGRIEAGLRGSGNLVGVGPGYTFETPVFGGQAAVSLLGLGGQSYGAVDATLTGPRGNTVSLARSESLTSVGDLIPLATLKWNQGVSNFMVYGTGDIPVGDYSTKRLVNLGLGHGAIDGGLGYTYLNPANKLEFIGGRGSDLQLDQLARSISERPRRPLRLGRFILSHQAAQRRSRRLSVPTGDGRPRPRSESWRVRIRGRRRRPAAQLLLPGDRQDSRVREREGLLGVRPRESSRRLERVAYRRLFARGSEVDGKSVVRKAFALVRRHRIFRF
jgi:hypothetical protein